jgi:hypothetical protein
MTKKTAAATTPSPTRFAELGYRRDFENCWRFVCIETDASVGPQYRTKAELLADLGRYASESWGLS